MAGVLIPTFGGIIDKANRSAAYQEARNAWTEYLTNVDYSKETAETDLVIVVDGGKYYVKVTDGKIAANAVKIDASATVQQGVVEAAKPADYTNELLDLDGTSAEVDGVWGKPAA